MTLKEREAIYKLAELVRKLTQAPATTHTPMTGEVYTPPPYQPSTTPLPLSPTVEGERYHLPTK